MQIILRSSEACVDCGYGKAIASRAETAPAAASKHWILEDRTPQAQWIQ